MEGARGISISQFTQNCLVASNVHGNQELFQNFVSTVIQRLPCTLVLLVNINSTCEVLWKSLGNDIRLCLIVLFWLEKIGC
jgi:hypothetical protein